MRGAEPERGGLAQSFSRLTEALSRLVSEHLALARVELRADARAVGSQVAKIAVFLPAIVVGYGLLCVALALGLAQWLGAAWAFALVGALNFVGGGLGAYFAAQRMSHHPVLETTRVEVEKTSMALGQAARAPNGAEKRLGA